MTEFIKENDLAVNQQARAAFEAGHEPLSGVHLYVLHAMNWGLENGAAEWAGGAMRYRLQNAVSELWAWRPSDVMRFLYDDGEGKMDEEAMDCDAGAIEGRSPIDVASALLETLALQLD